MSVRADGQLCSADGRSTNAAPAVLPRSLALLAPRRAMPSLRTLVLLASTALQARAHVREHCPATEPIAQMAPWIQSMYGYKLVAPLSAVADGSSSQAQMPMTNLPFDKWWMAGFIDSDPPPAGAIADLPAGGKITLVRRGKAARLTSTAHCLPSQLGAGGAWLRRLQARSP